MKNFCVLLVALSLINGAMTQWVHQNPGTSNLMLSVCFPGESTGYAVGYNHTVLKTTDGGNHWTV